LVCDWKGCPSEPVYNSDGTLKQSEFISISMAEPTSTHPPELQAFNHPDLDKNAHQHWENYQEADPRHASEPTKNFSNPESYQDWISSVQSERNAEWKFNVQFHEAADTESPPEFDKFTLFHDGVENYAMNNTTVSSKHLQNVANMTQEKGMFSPCMVGTLESQFLKMQCLIKGARRCLDVGTFTGMSALAMAEGIPHDGQVVTLEFDPTIAKAAQEGFDASGEVSKKIRLILGNACDEMVKLKATGETFDIIFIDADKENYIKYYNLAMEGLLKEDGIILVDNSLCALLYDKQDIRSQKIHEFNQYVKNDERVEQVVLTLREGVTIIRRRGQRGIKAGSE